MSISPVGRQERNVRVGPSLGLAGVCTRAQVARLLKLLLVLQARQYPNARMLAEHCEVSRRTIHRDLEILAEANVPVRFDPQRQGYALDEGFFLPPTNLSGREALALLVLTRRKAWDDPLGLFQDAWMGANKLVEGMAPEDRERIRTLAEPFQAEEPGQSPSPERQAIYDAILKAVAERRQVRLWYLQPASLDEICTKFSAYRLVLHDNHWSLVGRSSWHRCVCTIGMARVRKAVLTDDLYVPPARFSLERFFGLAWGVERSETVHHVLLRFLPRFAPEVDEVRWHNSQRTAWREDGGLDVEFTVQGLEEILRWALRFGDGVEVIAPPELRRRMFELASAIARLHEGSEIP